MCQAWACWQVTFSLQHYCYYYSKKYAAIENRGVFFICLRLSKKAYSTPPPTHFNVCVCVYVWGESKRGEFMNVDADKCLCLAFANK